MQELLIREMGRRLAQARSVRGLTLEQVSVRSGLAVGYVSQLETGSKRNPTLGALVRLSGALGVSVSFLVGEG